MGRKRKSEKNTSYFNGDYEEIVEEKESTRDLVIVMQNNACFDVQIEKVRNKKVRQGLWEAILEVTTDKVGFCDTCGTH